jgi:hypothetical protein
VVKFKVKFEHRASGVIDYRSVLASDPQSAANEVRKMFAGQQIIVVTVKREKVAA